MNWNLADSLSGASATFWISRKHFLFVCECKITQLRKRKRCRTVPEWISVFLCPSTFHYITIIKMLLAINFTRIQNSAHKSHALETHRRNKNLFSYLVGADWNNGRDNFRRPTGTHISKERHQKKNSNEHGAKQNISVCDRSGHKSNPVIFVFFACLRWMKYDGFASYNLLF